MAFAVVGSDPSVDDLAVYVKRAVTAPDVANVVPIVISTLVSASVELQQ
jgi:hypothetical protein